MYSEYSGIKFLKDYVSSRQKYLNQRRVDESQIKDNCIQTYSRGTEALSDTMKDLLELRNQLRAGHVDVYVKERVNAYTKSFEVRKRLYNAYDSAWKPVGSMDFEDYTAYLVFAECLAVTFQNTNCLKYFSCLLKVDDALLSVYEKLDAVQMDKLYWLIEKELGIFYQIMDERGICLEGAYGTK